MDIRQIFSITWLPLLIGVLCLFSGIMTLKTNDIKHLHVSKSDKEYKDKDSFAQNAGKLMTILGVCAFVMALLLLFSTVVATVFGLGSFLAFGIMWKRMNDNFGPK